MFWVTWLHLELQGQPAHLELDRGSLGFVIGPLFSVYNSSLNDFIWSHNFKYHLYPEALTSLQNSRLMYQMA